MYPIYLNTGPRIETENDSFFIEWFKEFWNSEVFLTYIGFIAYEVNPDDLFITHFFIGKDRRKDIERFHDFFKSFQEIARGMGKKKIRTSIHKSTPRWRELLWVEQRVAGFKITSKTEDEFMLEYIL